MVTRDHGEMQRLYSGNQSSTELEFNPKLCYMLHMHIISVLDAKMSLYSRLFVDKHNKVILLGNN